MIKKRIEGKFPFKNGYKLKKKVMLLSNEIVRLLYFNIIRGKYVRYNDKK